MLVAHVVVTCPFDSSLHLDNLYDFDNNLSYSNSLTSFSCYDHRVPNYKVGFSSGAPFTEA